jgi:thiosulfate reductase cytochrome b subunit
MNRAEEDRIDSQMRQVFAVVAPEVPDRGFTDGAMRRISRMTALRRLASVAVLIVLLPLLVVVLAAVVEPADSLGVIAGSTSTGPGWDTGLAFTLCLLLAPLLVGAVRE